MMRLITANVWIYAIFSILLFLPMLAFADGPSPDTNFGWFGSFFGGATSFINGKLLPLVFALAVVVFFWGIFTYFVLGGADETKREEGRKLMLYAVAGFVLMVTIFGIVSLVKDALFKSVDENINLPEVTPKATPADSPGRPR